MLRLPVAHTWDGAPVGPDEVVSVEVQTQGTALEIRVDAPFHGDPPPPGAPGPTMGLWDYEVVELFVVGPPGSDGARRYTEVELSPHGHHLVLRLRGVRNIVEKTLPMHFVATVTGNRWTGLARLSRDLLPPKGPLCWNAYAIHGVGASRRYLAHTPVPGPSPDFHRLDPFVEHALP